MANLTNCALCGALAAQKCGGCKNVVYCGRDHQRSHWKKHKTECQCYEIVVNESLGRHLRATRDIKRGEIIIRESPMIVGPKMASAPMCLGCHRQLQAPAAIKANYYKCRKCGWPLCGAECENTTLHREECALMAARKFTAKIDYSATAAKKESAYCVILPLRCILLKQSNAAAYARFCMLEDNLKQRLETPLYKILRANLVTFVQTVLGLNAWTDEEILRVAAILDTNAFEVRQPSLGIKVRAVFPNAAMISHDCVSNARHTFDEQMQIVFIAKLNIAKGDIIATSYTQPLKSTLMRRLHLAQAKCFDCTCARCSDATELGTYIGAIICGKCKVGKIISTSPLNNAAAWRCQLCAHELSAKQIIAGNAAMQQQIGALNKSSAVGFEQFIVQQRDTLHELNTHVLQLKYALTQLYGNAMLTLDESSLARKIELCSELLQIAKLLDDGSSIFRGNLLMDLQQALVMQAKLHYQSGLLTNEQMQQRLQESMTMLLEAVEIMKFEPELQNALQQRVAELNAELESLASTMNNSVI